MNSDIDKLLSQTIHIVKFVVHQNAMSFEERTATILQFHALSFLAEQPEAKLSDVAKHLQASLSSTTQLIERIHKLGLITRVGDVNDRRVIRLSVTKEGLEKLQQMKEVKRERMKKLLSSLDKHDLKELLRIQEKLVQNIK